MVNANYVTSEIVEDLSKHLAGAGLSAVILTIEGDLDQAVRIAELNP